LKDYNPRYWAHLKEFDQLHEQIKALKEAIDAARLEGIRLGLEAAHMAVWEIANGANYSEEDWEDRVGVTAAIRALDPATIAKETAR